MYIAFQIDVCLSSMKDIVTSGKAPIFIGIFCTGDIPYLLVDGASRDIPGKFTDSARNDIISDILPAAPSPISIANLFVCNTPFLPISDKNEFILNVLEGNDYLPIISLESIQTAESFAFLKLAVGRKSAASHNLGSTFKYCD